MAFQIYLTPTTFIISLFILILSFSFTPSHSALTCASQNLNSTYANCTNLPSLNATLHFTFNATNRSLSVAFSAVPPSPTGWVSWGLNLVGEGMVGAEALVALPSSPVRRYKLTSYKIIDEVKAFSFDSWDLSSEAKNGIVTIFAAVKIPETVHKLSHVWQVGPVAPGNKPAVHAFEVENLNAKAELPVALTATTTIATAPSPLSEDKNNGVARHTFGVGFYFLLIFALMGAVVAH